MISEMLRQQIATSICEEEKDAEKYESMACEAEENGHRHIAGMLRDIASEEKTHKNLLESLLK